MAKKKKKELVRGCKGITEAIRQHVAKGVQQAHRDLTGGLRRSAAKSIDRALTLIEKTTPGVWTVQETQKMVKQAVVLTRKLYSGGEAIEDSTRKKMITLLDDIEKIFQKRC